MRVLKKQINKLVVLSLTAALVFEGMPAVVYAAEEGQMEKKRVMVSLGDSYSSGEGIEPFYGQDADVSEKVKNPDWLAHRSQKSWSGMLTLPGVDGCMADNRNTSWYFDAASGAVTDNLYNSFTKNYAKGKYTGSYDLSPQLDIFNQIGENEVDYVTFTFGGNDVGFNDIIVECVTGSTYLNTSKLSDLFVDTWKEFDAAGGTKDKLQNAYISVAEKAGSQAHIIVAGYPKLLDQTGRGAAISQEEATMVNENVTKFNQAINAIVYDCYTNGMNIDFVSVEEAFNGHEAYSPDPYINKIYLVPKGEDLKTFQVASAYSVHPNEKGAQTYAACVQEKINEIELYNSGLGDLANIGIGIGSEQAYGLLDSLEQIDVTDLEGSSQSFVDKVNGILAFLGDDSILGGFFGRVTGIFTKWVDQAFDYYDDNILNTK